MFDQYKHAAPIKMENQNTVEEEKLKLLQQQLKKPNNSSITYGQLFSRSMLNQSIKLNASPVVMQKDAQNCLNLTQCCLKCVIL